MNGDNNIGATEHGSRHHSWLTNTLLALGAWLVVSPLVLSTTRVTVGVFSAITSGLALAVLAGWARAGRNPIPPFMIALSFGLWLLLAPSAWEFRDGADTGLVPITPSDAIEPTRAAIARAEWNSILAGLLTLALAGAVLVTARRQRPRSAPSSGTEQRRRIEAPGRQR